MAGVLKEVAHEVEIPLTPILALRHPEPAFALQIVEEDDTAQELLDIVSYALLIASELSLELRVRLMNLLFDPSLSPLDISLPCDVGNEVSIMLSVVIEEFLR